MASRAIGSSRATFALKSDATSLSVYPFRFELTVQFALAGAALTVTTSVKNTGDADLPASIGYHPAFCWPLPFGQARAAHFIEFAQDEAAPIRRLDGAGLLLSEGRPTPVVGRRLALTDELFRDDVMIFDNLRSRYLTYGAEEGPRIRIDYPDSPYLGVWTKPGANFICIEPWHGVADPEDYAGDFRAKPGVFLVAAGAAHAATLCITLLEHAG
jgi:galactose mutarotase-like enzyme